ncbi:hypothetical protein [Spiroplasma apis]|uniref:Uncharacterized protein n=1 Tax=Spiroplasma apis B31 TaxID=1276258 RepID=V5RJ24_SPIAP|nr:hypothetical protein [Spiroplasma apis]AHB36544.1 hypothetical protein SAPIS_v1c06990 [Spiroplasma apis B31]
MSKNIYDIPWDKIDNNILCNLSYLEGRTFLWEEFEDFISNNTDIQDDKEDLFEEEIYNLLNSWTLVKKIIIFEIENKLDYKYRKVRLIHDMRNVYSNIDPTKRMIYRFNILKPSGYKFLKDLFKLFKKVSSGDNYFSTIQTLLYFYIDNTMNHTFGKYSRELFCLLFEACLLIKFKTPLIFSQDEVKALSDICEIVRKKCLCIEKRHWSNLIEFRQLLNTLVSTYELNKLNYVLGES